MSPTVKLVSAVALRQIGRVQPARFTSGEVANGRTGTTDLPWIERHAALQRVDLSGDQEPVLLPASEGETGEAFAAEKKDCSPGVLDIGICLALRGELHSLVMDDQKTV